MQQNLIMTMGHYDFSSSRCNPRALLLNKKIFVDSRNVRYSRKLFKNDHFLKNVCTFYKTFINSENALDFRKCLKILKVFTHLKNVHDSYMCMSLKNVHDFTKLHVIVYLGVQQNVVTVSGDYNYFFPVATHGPFC